MSGWKQKRFWTDVQTVTVDGGFAVVLDGRFVKTPGKAAFVVPTRAVADAVAAEWAAQDEVVNPPGMPFTRTANAAIDKVAVHHAEVADLLAAYGDSDLLCYRAEHPAALIARQAEQWDPALDWAEHTLQARLESRPGLMHAAQDAGALSRLRDHVHGLSAFELAAFHDLVTLSGSLILGFAAVLDWKPADEIWTLSRLDELWQEEQWGQDEEAQAAAHIKRHAFLHARHFFSACAAQPLD
ncbi:MAG: ATPase [Rhodobacteraceae bacterium]|nr:ATPase [Paracoccaceae bacterium]